MGDSNEHKKFYEILSLMLIFVVTFVLYYYKKYVLGGIFIWLVIFYVKPKIDRKQKKFYEILSLMLIFVVTFVLYYYKKYVLGGIFIWLVIFYVKPKIDRKQIIGNLFFMNILNLKGMNQMVESKLVAIKVSPLLILLGIIIIIGVGLSIYMKKRNKS